MFRKKTIPLIAMISPVTLCVVVLIAIPLVYVLVISFCDTDASHNIKFSFTLKNYIRLFSPDVLTMYLNSLIIASLATVFCILIGYPFAHIMSNSTPFKKSLMLIFLMLPFWTNSIIRLYSWRTLLGTNGYINMFLLHLGLIKKPLGLYPSLGAVILGMVYTLLPFMVLPIHTVIDKLDRSLLEASADLGAKPVSTFMNITLPLTASGVFAGTIMVFIPSLGYFFVSNLMGGAKHQLISNVIQRQFKEAFNWPFGAALSIVLILITLVMVKAYTKSGGSVDDLGVL
jgi:spermidine/putrescine transport system permease protein